MGLRPGDQTASALVDVYEFVGTICQLCVPRLSIEDSEVDLVTPNHWGRSRFKLCRRVFDPPPQKKKTMGASRITLRPLQGLYKALLGGLGGSKLHYTKFEFFGLRFLGKNLLENLLLGPLGSISSKFRLGPLNKTNLGENVA